MFRATTSLSASVMSVRECLHRNNGQLLAASAVIERDLVFFSAAL